METRSGSRKRNASNKSGQDAELRIDEGAETENTDHSSPTSSGTLLRMCSSSGQSSSTTMPQPQRDPETVFLTSSPTSSPSRSKSIPAAQPSTSTSSGLDGRLSGGGGIPPPVLSKEVLRQRIEARVNKETEEKAKTSYAMRQLLQDRDDSRGRLSVAFALLEYLEELQQRLDNHPEEFYCSAELPDSSS